MTMRFVQDLIPELADTIITSQFDLRIHADDLLEYQKYSVLDKTYPHLTTHLDFIFRD